MIKKFNLPLWNFDDEVTVEVKIRYCAVAIPCSVFQVNRLKFSIIREQV